MYSSSIRVDIFGSASYRHRAIPCPKRVVELKASPQVIDQNGLHLYVLVQHLELGFWRSACDIRAAKMMMVVVVMHSVVHFRTKGSSVHAAP